MTPQYIGRAKRSCPLCGEKSDSLDTHHWEYDPEITVQLCRSCHDHIHASLLMPDNTRVSTQTRGFGGDTEWQDIAYQRALKRYERIHGIVDDWEVFWDRLNIPDRDWRVSEI